MSTIEMSAKEWKKIRKGAKKKGNEGIFFQYGKDETPRCPIKIDENDTEAIIKVKWEEIKKWYAAHPEAEEPWKEWVDDNVRLSNQFLKSSK